jgi:D-arabinose 1-dehydrogenase-like Zn-dependent alcohol dehydrogenase
MMVQTEPSPGDDAYERLLRSDVKYRFVIDMAWLD